MHPTLRDTMVALYGEKNIAALEAATPEDAPAAEPDELVIIPDDAEAERFRLECERDERIGQDDWP